MRRTSGKTGVSGNASPYAFQEAPQGNIWCRGRRVWHVEWMRNYTSCMSSANSQRAMKTRKSYRPTCGLQKILAPRSSSLRDAAWQTRLPNSCAHGTSPRWFLGGPPCTTGENICTFQSCIVSCGNHRRSMCTSSRKTPKRPNARNRGAHHPLQTFLENLLQEQKRPTIGQSCAAEDFSAQEIPRDSFANGDLPATKNLFCAGLLESGPAKPSRELRQSRPTAVESRAHC